MTLRTLLTDDLLKTLNERAAGYDRDNRFFAEDLADLREIGYLRIAVPEELGGLGFSLAEVVAEQRRLAYWAPATALGINMHLYWTGPAADAFHRGDRSVDWLSRAVADGKVIAAGHGEPGNDVAIDDSLTKAVRVDGGYRITGHKIFTSLSPAWDWLGIHARNDSDPENPRILHAFVARGSDGIEIRETWDTLGVRATSSHDTLLTDVFVSDAQVVDVHDLGAAPGAYVQGIFPWVLTGLGNIYYSIGRRALDLAIDAAGRKKSLALGGAANAQKPFVQYHVAEGEIALDAAAAQLDLLAADLTAGVDYGDRTLLKLFAAKENGARTGRNVVDLALRVAGAGSIHRSNELERLYRDVRAGAFHPPNSDAAIEVIGKTALGILS